MIIIIIFNIPVHFFKVTIVYNNHLLAQLYGIKYSYQIQIICTQLCNFSQLFQFNNTHLFAHTGFQTLLSTTNNFQTDLFDPLMGPKQVLLLLLLWIRMDLRVMTMKWYSSPPLHPGSL